MKSPQWVVCAVVSILVASSAALAQSKTPEVAPPGPNVEITIALGETGKDTALRNFKMIARDGAPEAELLIGWRVPIPTTKSGEEAGSTLTSYVYQNVGVTVRLQVVRLSDGRILARGEIEASGSKEGPASLQETEEMPIVATFQQSLDVILQDGKPLRVAEVPDPAGSRRYVDLTARVMP